MLDKLPIDLKKKYNAEWALVTGASSGIGLAMTRKLCGQGLNVVMVALEDDMLKKSFAAIKKEFPNCTIREVRAAGDLIPGAYTLQTQPSTQPRLAMRSLSRLVSTLV